MNISGSFGISAYYPNYSLKEIIEEADKAMYFAKKSGKNALGYFNQNTQKFEILNNF